MISIRSLEDADLLPVLQLFNDIVANLDALVNLVDDCDVRVFERSRGLGLLNKTALAVGVGDEFGREDLQGDLAVELQVEGLVDNAHTAAANLFEHFVVGEGAADHSFSSVTTSMTQMSPSSSSQLK